MKIKPHLPTLYKLLSTLKDQFSKLESKKNHVESMIEDLETIQRLESQISRESRALDKLMKESNAEKEEKIKD